MRKRILSFVLALTTVLLAIPAAVFPVMAAEATEDPIVLSSTVFAPNRADTWPIFDEYDKASMAQHAHVGVTYQGGWEIGYKYAGGNSANFTAYTGLYKALNSETSPMILSSDSGYWEQWGGLYIEGEPHLFFSGVDLDEAEGYKTATVRADPTVRYTAKETGTIRISLNKLYFYADMATYFTVYHNGVPVHEPIMADNAKSQIINGAFAARTPSNMGSAFGVVTVDVQKGDSIDFVSHANKDFCADGMEKVGLDQFTSAEYSRSKRGIYDYEFQIDYIVEKATYSTGFAPKGENFPVFEGYSAATMQLGDSVGVSYPGAWQVGYRDHAATGADFTPYDKLIKANEAGQMILCAEADPFTNHGGMYVTGMPSLMFSGIRYADGYASVSEHVADPVIRYTAEYTGTAFIKVNELYFYTNGTAYFDILHNGVRLTDPYAATDAQYRVQDGAYASAGAANKGADFGVIRLELTEGDTVDFVSRANDSFDAAHASSLGLDTFGEAEYAYAGRGVLDFDLEIVYRAEQNKEHRDRISAANVLSDVSLPEPLFLWYNAKGELLSDGDVREKGGTLPNTAGSSEVVFSSLVSLFDWLYAKGGSYAKINPALIENGTLTATDSYATVLSKYKTYLSAFTSLTFPDSFVVGAGMGSSLTPFEQLCFFAGSNPFSVTQTNGLLGATVDYGFGGQHFATAAQFAATLDAYIANAAAVQPSGSAASELRLTEAQLPEGKALSVDATLPSGATLAYANGDLFLCPVANGVAAYAYTVPSGYDRATISFTVSDVRFNGSSRPFHYAIAVNGEVVWPAGATASSFTSDHAAQDGWEIFTSLSAMQKKLSALTLEVESGDVVEICVANAYKNGTPEGEVAVSLDLLADTAGYLDVCALDVTSAGKHLYRGLYEFGSTVTLADLGLPTSFGKNGVYISNASVAEDLPSALTMYRNYRIADMVLESSASLSIASAFAVNIYVQAQAGASEAGVVIGGEKLAGVPQGNNVYKCSIPVAPKDMPATEVTYAAYQTKDGADTVNADTVTLRAFDLLAAYEASEDETTVLLAKTVRYYSLAARDYFINEKNTLSVDVKNALRGRANSSTVGTNDEAILSMVEAYHAGTAFVPYPAGVDTAAFPFLVHSATLKLDDTLGFAFRAERTSGALFGDPALTLRVTDENGNLRYQAEPAFLYDAEGHEMVYLVGNLPATEYGSEFYFTLVNGGGEAVSATLTYSAHAYIARTFDTKNGDESALHYLLRGIYALGEASAEYIEVHSFNYNKDYVYDIGDGGDSLAANDPVLHEVSFDATHATILPSLDDFLGAALVSGGVYKIGGGTLTLSAAHNGLALNGNGAILSAPNGLYINGATDLTISDLVIAGPVIIQSSQNVIFDGCQILNASGTAVTINENSSDVVLGSCRIIGKDGIVNEANSLTLLNSYVGFAEKGLADTAESGTTVQNCRLEGTAIGTAISSTAAESSFRFNTVKLAKTASVGMELAGDGNMLNVLVAQNVITGTRNSMRISGVHNTSVVLNSVVTVEAANNKSLYICDNAIGGRLVLSDNDYLLADGNRYPDDAMVHTSVSENNTNTNGDSLMDVNARAEVGADEALLPHVDKDLFLEMERKETVKDVTTESELDVYQYIMTNSRASDSHYVVVAPGAYLLKDSAYAGKNGLEFKTAASNGDRIYAYGVYAEHEAQLLRHITVREIEDLAIKGLSVGYAAQSVGQAQVVRKLSATTFLAIAPAGMAADVFLGGQGTTYLHRTSRGEDYIFCDLSSVSAVDNGDGTMTVTFPAAFAELISVGDSLTRRAASGSTTVNTTYSSDILYQDMTIFGNSAGLCLVEGSNTGYVTYHRILDTNRNGYVIDEATYESYEALEATYGVDLDIRVDEKGRLRGATHLVGSVDATHAASCKYGSQIISCVFENMCDDGTNQKSYSGRLSAVTDNGDSTTTLYYKSVLSRHSLSQNSTSTNICPAFLKGERVFVYTSAGREVCDTVALADAVSLGSHKATENGVERTFYDYAVTVPTDAVNVEATEGFDLSLDTADDANKILIDNRTRASNGFLIDNTVIDGTRSRALLIKSSDGVIRNCTLRNAAKVGVAVLYEIVWGESGVSENLTIENNLFENISYSVNNSGHYAHYPIFIKGLGDKIEEEYLSYRDITIRGNMFRHRHSETAVYIQSAQRVSLIDNDFGTAPGETEAAPKPSVLFNGAMGIELSGNTYSPYVTDVREVYTGEVKNVHGSDVSKYPFHDAAGTLHIRYQDTYVFPVAIEAIENAVITSKVTGTDAMDANLLVIREDGRSVYADGCGTATVRLADGRRISVVVEASDISLFFVTGQSNASGDHSFQSTDTTGNYEKYHHTYADYFIRTAPTMAYFTFTGQALSLTGNYNPENSVTDTLDWESAGNQVFVDPKVFSTPVGSTTFGNAGWSAALAHEWVEQTGERVWIVNASHGGHGIAEFAPSDDGTPVDNDYYQAVAVFNEALKTLYAEVDAGHFTLSHMAYYWFHGCADYQQSEEYYTTGFAKMHTAMQADVVYDHAGVEHKLEFCGLMDIRSKHDSSGNSYAEKYLTGPRLSHYQAASATSGVFHNVYLASNVTERWLGDDQNVVDYFLETYGSAENFRAIFGYDMPTTRFELHPNVHYLMMGHNEMGMDCARNTLRIINALGVGKTYVHDYEDDSAVTVTLVGRDGHTPYTDFITLEKSGVTTVVPMATPSFRTLHGLRLVSETEGFSFDGFELSCTDSTKKQIRIAIYLGDTKLETRTLAINQASIFSSHTPTVSGSTATMQGPWSLGAVSLSGGTYTPYVHVKDSWLSSVADSAHNAAGSFLAGSWNASMQKNMSAAAAITYTVEEDGCLAIAAEQFNAATYTGGAGTFLAVMVNGRKVWPTSGSAPYSLPTSVSDTAWKYMAKSATSTEDLNALWQNVRLNVSKGDLVQFCLISDATRAITGGETQTNSQPILLPYVSYVEVTSSAFTDHTPTYSTSANTATMNAPWSVGSLTLTNGSFATYQYCTTSGWVSGVSGNAQPATGSFFATSNWRANMKANATAASTMCYTAEKNGTISLSAESFSAANMSGATGTFLAVMVNGRRVWPTSGTAPYSLPTATTSTDWQFFGGSSADSANETATLNAAWADLRISVNKGDLVQFCLISDADRSLTGGTTKTNAQPHLHPIVNYVD